MKSTTQRNLFASAVLLACVVCYIWLSFGIYSDREFDGLRFFRKHQLYYRFFFYSPHGESDTPETTDAERSAEHDYTEFIEFKGGRERSWTLLK
jgi:hypothetical protein